MPWWFVLKGAPRPPLPACSHTKELQRVMGSARFETPFSSLIYFRWITENSLMWKSEVGNNLYCCSLKSSVLALLGHLPLRCSQHRIWAHTSRIVGDEKEKQQKKAYVGKTAQHDSSWWILPALSHIAETAALSRQGFFIPGLRECWHFVVTSQEQSSHCLEIWMEAPVEPTCLASCALPSLLCTTHLPQLITTASLSLKKAPFPLQWAYGRGKGGTRPGNAFAHCSIPRQAGWARTIGTVARATASWWHFLRKASRFPPPFRLMWIRQHLVPASGVMTTAQGRTEAPAGPSGTRTPPDRRACQLACGHLTRQ